MMAARALLAAAGRRAAGSGGGGAGALGAAATPGARALGASRAAASSTSGDAPAQPFSYDPPGRNHLFVPGPTNVPERFQRAMVRGGQNHRDAGFSYLVRGLLEDLKGLLQTSSGQPFIFPATGTGAWESALANTLSPGDKVIAYRMGTFSHLWIDMARRMGLEVKVIECRWGDGADEAQMEQCLKEDLKTHGGSGKIKAVLFTHNETTTGVTSDVKRIREAMDAAKHPALLMVDAVSSLGAADLRMDEWGVDVIVSGSQKALSLPPGLGLTCVSQKALAKRPEAKLARVFFSYDDHMRMYEEGNFPYTPAVPMLYGLREALDKLNEEGLQNVFARHARLAEGTRRAVKAWGLKLLCENPRWYSNALTVIQVPRGIDSGDIVKTAFSKYNLPIGVGLMRVQGEVFRIGHLGDMNEVSQLGAIAGVEMTLIDCGVNVKPGSGAGAAVKYFQETSSVIPTREMPGVH